MFNYMKQSINNVRNPEYNKNYKKIIETYPYDVNNTTHFFNQIENESRIKNVPDAISVVLRKLNLLQYEDILKDLYKEKNKII